MTTNDAAAVLEYIVEKRGAEWVASNWGLGREQLARWYEGQEELPPEMVFAMRVWVSAVRKPRAEAGCFEDSDHPPKPTIKWDDAVAWTDDGGQITIRMAEDQGDARPMSLGDLMAGKAKISVELNEQGEWIGQWKPMDADDHPPEVPEEVTETGWNAVPIPTVGRGEICIAAKSRGELLWEGHRWEVGPPSDSELEEMVEMAWQAAGARYDVDVINDYYWLVAEFPREHWPTNLPWDRLVDWLRGHIYDQLGIDR